MPENSTSSPTEGFALIIGINQYRSGDFRTLNGAVNDARNFKKFLSDSRGVGGGLQVPDSNIICLENEQATRSAILETFQSHFLNNPSIPDHGNTTMIFFFAGHGGRMLAPGNLMAFDGQIEGLCPADEGTTDADGENYVHMIPDYVLGRLLFKLSEKKGKNITVVLDSCHSGGMARNVGQARSRDSPSLFVPLSLDKDLWEGENQTAQSFRLWSPPANTYVLLAACREKEAASDITETHSEPAHGRFTQSLITCLRRVALEETTYIQLFEHILKLSAEWTGQTPHCGGSLSLRGQLLFQKNYVARGPQTFPVKLLASPDATQNLSGADIVQSFEIDIGTVDGVVNGTEFRLCTPNETSPRILVAFSVKIGRTLLETQDKKPLELPAGSCVEVLKWNNDAMILRVYTPPAADFPYTTDIFPTFVTSQYKASKYVQAASAESADLTLRVASDDTTPSTQPDIILEWSTGKILASQPLKKFSPQGLHLPRVIDGIAHFNYFFQHKNSDANGLIPGVTLEMHRLVGDIPGREPDMSARNGNFIAKVGSKYEATFVPEPENVYGFTIRNNSPYDLFPYLFYFDPVTYTIALWHSPSGDRVHAPLKNGGTVRIGMGGDPAWRFGLEPGQESESWFLKLFVATEPLEIEWINQISAFELGREPRYFVIESRVYVPKWDTFNVAVKLCRELPPTVDAEKQ